MISDIKNEEEDELEDNEDNVIRWSNLLFLPFNPVFKSLVLITVVIKTILVSF